MHANISINCLLLLIFISSPGYCKKTLISEVIKHAAKNTSQVYRKYASSMFLRRLYSAGDDKNYLYEGKLISAFTTNGIVNKKRIKRTTQKRRERHSLKYDIEPMMNWLAQYPQANKQLYLRANFGFNYGKVLVYAIIKNKRKRSLVHLDTRKVRKWTTFNISKMIKDIDRTTTAHEDHRVTLFLRGKASIGIEKRDEIAKLRSFLVGFVSADEPYNSREKRELHDKSSNQVKNSHICHLDEYVIDFSHFGWDRYIVFPKKFSVGRCTGSCSFQNQNFKSNYALMCHIARHIDHSYSQKPSCAPSNLASLKLIYAISDEQAAMIYVDDMIVKDCECI